MINELTQKVIDNGYFDRNDIDILLNADTETLCSEANKIREHFCSNSINLCAIISGKGGGCSENCRFCAQSSHYGSNCEKFDFIDTNTIVDDCKKHLDAGINRYSIVTVGRALKGKDFDDAIIAYNKMKKYNIGLCASHGLLSYSQLQELKNSGVSRYHCNIESSREYFDKVCTTHSFDDKIQVIKNAQAIGLEICSGGIIGMGESMEDRISMAFTLAELGVNSIPINILTPIKNTPFENCKALSEDEILRTVAIFRFINPKSQIRIAAGRKNISNNGLKLFQSGANSTITGDFLTTTGSTIAKDIEMFENNGFKIEENNYEN